MNTPLSHRWAMFAARTSRSVWNVYVCLIAAGFFAYMGATSQNENAQMKFVVMSGFLLVSAVVYWERRAFGQIIALKDQQIQKLRSEIERV